MFAPFSWCEPRGEPSAGGWETPALLLLLLLLVDVAVNVDVDVDVFAFMVVEPADNN